MRDAAMDECDIQACGVGIAIVEDEKELVKVYEKILLRNKIEICFIAYDGLEAIKKYVECTPRPHVMLMDYRLPVMDGIEATREILKIDPKAKIIFLSADVGVKDEAMRAGAVHFLKKPVHVKDIISATLNALGRKI
jgi:two-component system chemotaxis response regulator CheY